MSQAGRRIVSLMVVLTLIATACGGGGSDEPSDVVGAEEPTAEPVAEDDGAADAEDDGTGGRNRCTDIVDLNISRPTDDATGDDILAVQRALAELFSLEVGESCPDYLEQRACDYFLGSTATEGDIAAQVILETAQGNCLDDDTETTTTTTMVSDTDQAAACESAAGPIADLFLENSADDFSLDDGDVSPAELDVIESGLDGTGCDDLQAAICFAMFTLEVNGVIPNSALFDPC